MSTIGRKFYMANCRSIVLEFAYRIKEVFSVGSDSSIHRSGYAQSGVWR